MTLYPAAEWRPLAAGDSGVRMAAHDIVCVHTMVGFLSGTEQMFRQDGWTGTESHFGVGGPADPGHDGTVYQWVDTDFEADANLGGNHRLISIETSDGGDETNPWSEAQLQAIADIIVWCCQEYAIPAELVADSAPGRRGIGYHRQGIDPWRVAGGETWSRSNGKVCPGDVRIAQLVEDVIPRVQRQVASAQVPMPLRFDTISPEVSASGTEVVLTGSGFLEATGVFFGDVWVESWSIDSDFQITATVPEPITSGPVWVGVTSSEATSEGLSFSYDETTTPTISLWSMTPDAGTSGLEVVLDGTGFSKATGLSFGDVWVESWSIDSDFQITATVPEPITSGSVWVTLTSADATSGGLLFAYED